MKGEMNLRRLRPYGRFIVNDFRFVEAKTIAQSFPESLALCRACCVAFACGFFALLLAER
jgi:hypothetical protein